VKEGAYYEQPDVHFKHALMVQFGTESGGTLFWSTWPRVNALMGPGVVSRVPAVRASEADLDRDGQADRLRVGVAMPIAAGDSVEYVRAMLFFHCELSHMARVEMETAAYLDAAVPRGATGLKLYGRFSLRQAAPFVLDATPRIVYNHSAVGNATDLPSVSFSTLVADFNSRTGLATPSFLRLLATPANTRSTHSQRPSKSHRCPS
jgi:hypothetical protein